MVCKWLISPYTYKWGIPWGEITHWSDHLWSYLFWEHRRSGFHHPKNQPLDLKLVETGDPEHWLARATWLSQRWWTLSNEVWRVTLSSQIIFQPNLTLKPIEQNWEWMYIISEMYMTWKCVVRIAEHAQYGFRDVHRHGEWSLQLHSCGRGDFAQFGHPLTSILES